VVAVVVLVLVVVVLNHQNITTSTVLFICTCSVHACDCGYVNLPNHNLLLVYVLDPRL
jgi:hypothetical protein